MSVMGKMAKEDIQVLKRFANAILGKFRDLQK